MDEVILAIDGGATKTDITVRSRDGTIFFNGKGKGLNYQTVGLDKVENMLSSLLTEVELVYPEMCIDVAVFALAGIDSKNDQERVKKVVKEVCRFHRLEIRKLVIENDAKSALLGVTENKPGALLIAGTGSIAYAHDGKGKIVRSGGWGHRAGDEGSGYWMGREVLRAVFRMEDGRGPATSLKRELLMELELGTVQDTAGWLFDPMYSVDQVAKLSRVLDKCALDGDREAIRITEEAADELALLISTVLRKSGLGNEPCKVFINGGAIIHSDRCLLELKNRVYMEFHLCELVVTRKAPIESIVARGWMALDQLT